MADTDDKAVRMELAQLRQEHRDLDAAVEALSVAGNSDALQLQRLKKKKLLIKDRITVLEDQLFPDIIA
ncbi:YdcH family protein [Roseibium sp.]|uniref:YdcH family protein n=1 Tax=Roseibium sp. TaxID=1936156 RepID=UPI003A973E8F